MRESADKRFACRCCGENQIDARIERLVSEIERDVGEALEVTSGYRCTAHNEKVKGSKTSSHLDGLAVDLRTATSGMRFRIVHSAMKHGVTRIGMGRGFVHLDLDRLKVQRVIWFY